MNHKMLFTAYYSANMWNRTTILILMLRNMNPIHYLRSILLFLSKLL
nr:MAG TPA: hypothetical protein [Caudoviricetes sp.]